MKILFMGTPQYAVPSLAQLLKASHEVVGVFTQPDRPVGRSQTPVPPPVKRFAIQHHLTLHSPENVKSLEVRDVVSNLNPDLIVVVAYGKILPQWLLQLPPQGAINVHGSLLPKYRGAAPIQWAVANGEERTGVTTMQMDAGLDTGDILLQREVVIAPDDTAQSLHDRLSQIGSELLVETLATMQAGKLHPQKQDPTQATFAPLLKKEDGRIDWNWPAENIHNRVRGFNPWPGTHTTFRGKNLRIWKTAARSTGAPAASSQLTFSPGRLIHVPRHTLQVQTGNGKWLELLEVQPEGHRRMSGGEFINGFRISDGERLGD